MDGRRYDEGGSNLSSNMMEDESGIQLEGYAGEQSTVGDGNEDSAVDSGIPDLMMLNLYCARAKGPRDTEESKIEAAKSWEPVRQWLSSHTADEVRAAAEQRGESSLTALHFACRHVPPIDVIDVFLSIAANTVQWLDTFGWLPIHYACASGSDPEVIKALAEAFPDSRTTVDRRGRTPLHFALGDKPASPDVIFLLSSSGAASYPDEMGMLPLHYACAFGASEEVLYVLTDAYPAAIETRDKRDRTPLHFALSNAGRKTVPSAVRLLLSLKREIVNSVDGGPLPLRVLSDYAQTVKNEDDKREEKRESVHRCLEHLLNAEPDPTADFLTALQSLPKWLRERAVVMHVVQSLLNEKIGQRLPTAFLMMDFYVLCVIIFYYSKNVVDSLQLRADPNVDDYKIEFKNLLALYVGGLYFALREVVQMISLLSLKSLDIWLYNPSNHLNVFFVFIIFYWTVRMNTGTGEHFRIGAALSVTVLWVRVLAYLRNMLIDFAVFVGGVFYVVQRLAAFLTALGVILIAFAQMFHTTFQESEYCLLQPNEIELNEEERLRNLQCGENEIRPYCSPKDSFLNVYTMLLGEVSEDEFQDSGVALALFIVFMFLVVILLANVLIAIVTESYKVIQNERAAIVFWTNRLYFVAEMDTISNGPWKSRLRQAIGLEGGDAHMHKAVLGKEIWKQLMDLFEDEVEDGFMSFDFLAYTFLRILAATVIIPFWLFVGIVTLGWFWPPQVREAVFTSPLQQQSDTKKEDERRKTQVSKLEEEIKTLRYDLLQELAMDRTQVVQLKSLVAERKLDIVNEMKDIKRIVAVLFERQAG